MPFASSVTCAGRCVERYGWLPLSPGQRLLKKDPQAANAIPRSAARFNHVYRPWLRHKAMKRYKSERPTTSRKRGNEVVCSDPGSARRSHRLSAQPEMRKMHRSPPPPQRTDFAKLHGAHRPGAVSENAWPRGDVPQNHRKTALLLMGGRVVPGTRPPTNSSDAPNSQMVSGRSAAPSAFAYRAVASLPIGRYHDATIRPHLLTAGPCGNVDKVEVFIISECLPRNIP